MQIRFLKQAIELAMEHSADGLHGPFGAVVVKNDVIVGQGWNSVVANHDPTAHAEVEAIRDACASLKTHDLTGAEIYASCEPCPMCLSAIYWARIKAVYYAASKEDAASVGFDDSLIYNEIRMDWSERSVHSKTSMHDEGKNVFNNWSRNSNRIEY
jgi:guanine deaminase